ncbi:MAG: Citrate transporter [Haloplasmataceae bacterium]|jgi:Na+/H+ antiporter NhaD/arsenite permease-like protein|nr:Citrate transporter [Haloplasmataceae bacterium]
MTLKIKSFIIKNIVVVIAILAAIITSFIIKPSSEYLNYFDYRTLTSLFISLAVICALKNIYFFQIVARKIVSMFKTTRSAVIALVYITFIGSMVIANDMALITFLPLGYYILSSTKQEKYMAFVFIMQNIAANLGGMLTPFGNPQNLYLFSYFTIDSLEFMKIMFLPFIVSIVLITICCLFMKNEKLELPEEFDKKLNIKRTLIYTILFLFTIIIIFRYIHYLYGLILIPLFLLILDKKSLKDVDYGLLITFCAFFVFAGNVSRIDAISNILNNLMEKSTLLVGVFSCQLISNVPSAIMLSKFTTNYSELLVAVNIGGTGTLISSLASLITYKEYVRHNPKKQLYYIKLYSLFNFGFLAILLLVSLLMFNL